MASYVFVVSEQFKIKSFFLIFILQTQTHDLQSFLINRFLIYKFRSKIHTLQEFWQNKSQNIGLFWTIRVKVLKILYFLQSYLYDIYTYKNNISWV